MGFLLPATLSLSHSLTVSDPSVNTLFPQQVARLSRANIHTDRHATLHAGFPGSRGSVSENQQREHVISSAEISSKTLEFPGKGIGVDRTPTKTLCV